MGLRLKGQETEVQIITSGKPLKSFKATNLDVTFKLKRMEQGYLGETSNRYDDVFEGIEGTMTLHLDDVDPMEFIDDMIDRARRRVSNYSVNVLTTFSFPGGKTRRYLIPDVYFNSPKLSDSGRTEYVTVTLDFAASEGKPV